MRFFERVDKRDGMGLKRMIRKLREQQAWS